MEKKVMSWIEWEMGQSLLLQRVNSHCHKIKYEKNKIKINKTKKKDWKINLKQKTASMTYVFLLAQNRSFVSNPKNTMVKCNALGFDWNANRHHDTKNLVYINFAYICTSSDENLSAIIILHKSNRLITWSRIIVTIIQRRKWNK